MDMFSSIHQQVQRGRLRSSICVHAESSHVLQVSDCQASSVEEDDQLGAYLSLDHSSSAPLLYACVRICRSAGLDPIALTQSHAPAVYRYPLLETQHPEFDSVLVAHTTQGMCGQSSFAVAHARGCLPVLV